MIPWYDVIVIGSGITGVATASALARTGAKVACIGPNRGGLIRSHHINNFSFDYGVHVYDGRDPVFHDILTRAGAEWHKRHAFYIKDWEHEMPMWVPYPVQDFAHMLGTYDFADRFSVQNPLTFRAHLLNEYGPKFYDDVLRPFNRRVWSTDPTVMDVDWIRNRVPSRSDTPRPNWGPNATYAYAPGEDIISAIVDGASVEFITSMVRRVDHDDMTLQITNEDDEIKTLRYGHLVSTLPIPKFSSLLGIDAPHGVFGNLRMNIVSVLGVSARKSIYTDGLDFSWAYLDVKERAHRISMVSRQHAKTKADDYETFVVEVPHHHDDAPNRKVFDDGARLCSHYLGPPLSDCRQEWLGHEAGYPVPLLGTRRLVIDWKRSLPSRVYSVGRWGSHAYFNADACVREAYHVARLIVYGGPAEFDAYVTSEAGFDHPSA